MTGRKSSRDRRRPGAISPEDADLWARVAGKAQPLRKRNKHVEIPEPPPEAAAPEPEPDEPSAPMPQQRQAAARPALPPLAPGAAPGVDRRTAERLRRGQLPVQARLDLHGNTQEEAHAALAGFIPEARAAGLRTVLVITGKGRRADGGEGVVAGRGVLWQMVPRWLNGAELRPHILAFAHAQPRHGGDGALYVLLRRMRD